jgi:hypothetical protein
VLDLGPQPVASHFTMAPNASVATHNLTLSVCRLCGIVQLQRPFPAHDLAPLQGPVIYREPEAHLDDVVSIISELPGPTKISVVGGLSSKDRTTIERIERQRSILDAVTGQIRRLQGNLGPNDRNRVSEYLDTVREIERRIQLAERQNGDSKLNVPASPTGIPDEHQEHSKLMFDLMALAFQADITRISTFMMAREVSYRTFPMLGISEGFHPASHHQNNPAKLEALTKINAYHVSLLAHLLERLKATPDGDGNLLDHSLILYGSAMSNSNIHDHGPLPVLVAGGANGRMKGGRHIKYPEGTPMANLLLTILQKANIHRDSVGDSTGPMTEL